MIDSVVFFLFIGLSTFFQLVCVKMKLGFVSWPRRLFPRTRFVLTQITPMRRKTKKKKKKERYRRAGSLYESSLFIPKSVLHEDIFQSLPRLYSHLDSARRNVFKPCLSQNLSPGLRYMTG